MKTMNIFGKAIVWGCSLLFSLTACEPAQEGPSVDDYFLNYEIEEVKPSQNIPVGALYYNVNSTGIGGNDNGACYNRLTGDYVADSKNPQLCPKVRPVLGHYKMDTNKADMAALVQQHIDWAQEAGIDFFILPAMRYDSKTQSISKSSYTFLDYVSGKSLSGNPTVSEGKINWGPTRYAVSVMMNDFSTGLSPEVRIEDDADANGRSARCEALYDYFVELVKNCIQDNDLYYTVDGKPMLVLWNAQLIYSNDSRKLYDTIRQRVKDETGLDLYIVARQPSWAPAARFHNFFMTGGVDAVYMDNMLNQTTWARVAMYPQYIDQNYKYNREYMKANYNVDFIPSISPSYNRWVLNGQSNTYNIPYQMHDKKLFKDLCNVAKMNLGAHPMVIIDSFNQWDTDTAIEPTDPYYGNGYGKDYLEMVRTEFKVN